MDATEQRTCQQSMGDITVLIQRARGGDRQALDSLFQALYPEMRRIAHARLRRGFPDPDLGTTALVHECYLKLHEAHRLDATDRAHFFAYAASAMRSIIVDIARAKATERRGANAVHVTLDDELAGPDAAAEDDILRVHEAVEEIGALDQRLARLVEMRYFGGMSDQEIASALDVTDRTVRRDWQKARLLLAAALR
jgi:RNA polymerase sigma factor (TIGR02999 family)